MTAPHNVLNRRAVRSYPSALAGHRLSDRQGFGSTLISARSFYRTAQLEGAVALHSATQRSMRRARDGGS